jgi:uncharacterized protein (DUF1697 family)
MNSYAVLLRGINVGRNNRIAMADLRELLTGLGYTDVATLLQSGNAVFSTDGADPAGLTAGGVRDRQAGALRVLPGRDAEGQVDVRVLRKEARLRRYRPQLEYRHQAARDDALTVAVETAWPATTR